MANSTDDKVIKFVLFKLSPKETKEAICMKGHGLRDNESKLYFKALTTYLHVKTFKQMGATLKRKNLLPITKTCLYKFDPLKPQFYIVKLGFTGVYIIFSYFCSKT